MIWGYPYFWKHPYIYMLCINTPAFSSNSNTRDQPFLTESRHPGPKKMDPNGWQRVRDVRPPIRLYIKNYSNLLPKKWKILYLGKPKRYPEKRREKNRKYNKNLMIYYDTYDTAKIAAHITIEKEDPGGKNRQDPSMHIIKFQVLTLYQQ